jgi:hypothetical protein
MFEDGEQYCKEWYTVYISKSFINILLAVWIALGNWFIQEIFNCKFIFLTHFFRYWQIQKHQEHL